MEGIGYGSIFISLYSLPQLILIVRMRLGPLLQACPQNKQSAQNTSSIARHV